MSKFLQFWCKLNTRRIVKICPFRFLRNFYGNSLDFMFPHFPNLFLPFSMVFPHISPGVSTISSGFSTVFPQCFPHFLFSILRFSYVSFQKYFAAFIWYLYEDTFNLAGRSSYLLQLAQLRKVDCRKKLVSKEMNYFCQFRYSTF